MLTIESSDGRHYATLADTERGVSVSIYRWSQRRDDASFAKRIDVWLMDCPFHVACDAMHEIVQSLAINQGRFLER